MFYCPELWFETSFKIINSCFIHSFMLLMHFLLLTCCFGRNCLWRFFRSFRFYGSSVSPMRPFFEPCSFHTKINALILYHSYKLVIDSLVFAMAELPAGVNHWKEGKMSEYRQPPEEDLRRIHLSLCRFYGSAFITSLQLRFSCLRWCDSAPSKEREQTDLCCISEVKRRQLLLHS